MRGKSASPTTRARGKSAPPTEGRSAAPVEDAQDVREVVRPRAHALVGPHLLEGAVGPARQRPRPLRQPARQAVQPVLPRLELASLLVPALLDRGELLLLLLQPVVFHLQRGQV